MGIKSQSKEKIANMKFTNAVLVSSVSCAWVNPNPFGVAGVIANNEMDKIDCANYRGLCTREFRPICASNGQSYGNPCLFLTEYCTADSTFRFVRWGECLVNDVVYGSDLELKVQEVAEAEEEIFESKNLKISDDFDKIQHSDCPLFCDRRLKPVCGSDGIRYSNKCLMDMKKCHAGFDIREVPCDEPEEQCERPCSRILAPVCASDGTTFSNRCEFEVAACQRSKNAAAPALTLTSTGPCTSDEILVDNLPNCTKLCSRRAFRPLCGSDGETYANKCFLDKKNCDDNTNVKQLHKGECK